jgi:hypothetical protein
VLIRHFEGIGGVSGRRASGVLGSKGLSLSGLEELTRCQWGQRLQDRQKNERQERRQKEGEEEPADAGSVAPDGVLTFA